MPSGILGLDTPSLCPLFYQSAHLRRCKFQLLQACQVAVPHRVHLLSLAVQERFEGQDQFQVGGRGHIVVSQKCVVIINRQRLHALLEVFAHGDDPAKEIRGVTWDFLRRRSSNTQSRTSGHQRVRTLTGLLDPNRQTEPGREKEGDRQSTGTTLTLLGTTRASARLSNFWHLEKHPEHRALFNYILHITYYFFSVLVYACACLHLP